jgi:hypothetical protein
LGGGGIAPTFKKMNFPHYEGARKKSSQHYGEKNEFLTL